MDAILKFNIVAGNKIKTFPLEQVWNSTGVEIGHYKSPFILTLETTYDYSLLVTGMVLNLKQLGPVLMVKFPGVLKLMKLKHCQKQ